MSPISVAFSITTG